MGIGGFRFVITGGAAGTTGLTAQKGVKVMTYYMSGAQAEALAEEVTVTGEPCILFRQGRHMEHRRWFVGMA